MEKYTWNNMNIPLIRHRVAVVGSGASGLAAVWHLSRLKVDDFCLVTEDMDAGTSRNTGSDKQTYYKLTLAGSQTDSITEMASTLFSGGSMDGDLARVEAALSAGCFSRLCDLGVPFPVNEYGEAAGYKTDHDPRQRATSAGPLTSKMMTEALQRSIEQQKILIYNGWQVVKILADTEKNRVCGLICLDRGKAASKDDLFKLIICDYIIYAVGGPAMLYADSVYPSSQSGATGLALEAGASGKNLTEWQFGLASVKPRWNVSGSFQQVLPRYWSVEPDGTDRKDFLDDVLTDKKKQLALIFRKGYEWPFDCRKISGSSLIDLLVYQETKRKGRRVFLDFRANPGDRKIDWTEVDSECVAYLQRAGALQDYPYKRLCSLNLPAAEFYKNRGVDLSQEPLEIKLCAQHHNGGLAADSWWQSDLSGLFPVGEANGSHGIYRPGGSALNSGQVGAARAAQWIGRHLPTNSAFAPDSLPITAQNQIKDFFSWLENCRLLRKTDLTIGARYRKLQERMSRVGGAFRDDKAIRAALDDLWREKELVDNGIPAQSTGQLSMVCRYRELVFSQIVFLEAIRDYIENGGGSRGSALYRDPQGVLLSPHLDDIFRCRPLDSDKWQLIQEAKWQNNQLLLSWRSVRPLPQPDDVFEIVWRQYRDNLNTIS